MEARPSISVLVAKAVSSGLRPRPLKRSRDKAARAEQRALAVLLSHNPADDSDFDDYTINDSIWNKRYKHEHEDYDQIIFNVFRQDKINNQERKVNITTAICIRDCSEKALEIAMWTKHAKPVLSKAPRKGRRYDLEKAKRDAELDKILAEAVEAMANPIKGKNREKRVAQPLPKSANKKKRTTKK